MCMADTMHDTPLLVACCLLTFHFTLAMNEEGNWLFLLPPVTARAPLLTTAAKRATKWFVSGCSRNGIGLVRFNPMVLLAIDMKVEASYAAGMCMKPFSSRRYRGHTLASAPKRSFRDKRF
uniref:Putative secreted protein n=1 Tax=Anopheles darlingi TaxID=43151 RepID=A0A2M4D3M5_ANODA